MTEPEPADPNAEASAADVGGVHGGDEVRPRQQNDPGEFAVAPGNAFAYVPGVVIVRGDQAMQRAVELARALGSDDVEAARVKAWAGDRLGAPAGAEWFRLTGVSEPLQLIGLLAAEGVTIQPDHVFFADSLCGCGNPCGTCDDTLGTWANPLRANPLRANPLRANPLRANPLRANPLRANTVPLSSALPVEDQGWNFDPLQTGGDVPRISVFDTGIAGVVDGEGNQRPGPLQKSYIAGDVDVADRTNDGVLDPVAGHGTFIAGIIEQHAPGSQVTVHSVMSPHGVVVESALVERVTADLNSTPRPDLISLSFGGTTMGLAALFGSMLAQARALGVIVVASAGNDSSCEPHYPAAFDSVIGVGALGPNGPASFTNYGPWVNASAPGEDLISTFFRLFNGVFPQQNDVDPDKFANYAQWSGTSFAAPTVAAAIARSMIVDGGSAADAAARVIDAPHLMRIPSLGTVVNI